MKKFNRIFDDITKPTFQKFGFANVKLAKHWPSIVGKQLSQICIPDKINFPPNQRHSGTLILKIFNPAFSLEIQALECKIIEKIATFFGYRAVSRIKIIVSPMAISIPAIKPKSPEYKLDAETIDKLNQIIDPDLRSALTSLAKKIPSTIR